MPTNEIKKSSKYIDQNIINYLSQVNEKGKLKKISTLNEAKIEKVLQNNNNYNGLNENVHIDFDRKNKARRSLLYLLNKMSGGTFCPQIINYFNEIRELNKQEEQLKEVKEEEIIEKSEEPIINDAKALIQKKNQTLLTNFKKPILGGQNKSNYINYKFQRRSGKNTTVSDKNEINIISKNYANDLGLKDMEKYIDIEEIEKSNANKFNFTKEAQAKKKFLEECALDLDDRPLQKKNKKHYKFKEKNENESDEEEERIEIIPNFKKNIFPNIKKLQLNRLNTISGGGFFKKNNFLNKEKANFNNYFVSSEIKEEK